MTIKKKAGPLLENVAESGAACLVTMVQGNLLLVGLTHWITATQTGLIAGIAATTAIALAKTSNRILVALILGTVTAVVDYFVHPGMLGEHHATEAIVTGLGAVALSYGISSLIAWFRLRRETTTVS